MRAARSNPGGSLPLKTRSTVTLIPSSYQARSDPNTAYNTSSRIQPVWTMTLEINLETVVSAIAVITFLNGAILGLMNLMFLRRNSFFAIRAKDEEKQAKSSIDLHRQIDILEGRFKELETQHRLLAEGPLKSVATTLNQVQQALGELNKQAEERNGKLIETLTKLDHRLIKVETRLLAD